MRAGLVATVALLAFCTNVSAGEGLEPPPAGLEARSIAARVEDVFRGNTSYLVATMTVKSPRLSAPRRVAFRAWDDRPHKRTFIRILAPPKDAGMAFLKLHPNLWNFIPRVERTIRIPPSMMLQSWMGSDFTNDDLVRESSQLDDYDHLLLGIDPDPDSSESERAYVIEYRPHEDAPVVWGRIVSWVDMVRYAPLRQEFYGESGEKLRVIHFSQIREVQGRPYPHRWSLVPLDKEGHETLVEIEEIRVDEQFDDAIFTKRNLTRRD
jgi:outer membrane lipoprotein-sorting protein